MARKLENEPFLNFFAKEEAEKILFQAPTGQIFEQANKRQKENSKLTGGQEFPLADSKIIYGVNNDEVEVIGSKFPEGVLPSNAIPLRQATFFSKAALELRKLFVRK